MSGLWQLVDGAVNEVVSSHPDYFTQKGHEAARRQIVRRITAALRDSMSAPKAKGEEEKTSPAPAHVAIQPWSKEWWAILLARIEQGRRVGWMIDFAKSGSGPFMVQACEMPAEDRLAALQGYPSDSNVWAVWRDWFARNGVRLPEWREKHWVFLPSPEPPSNQSAA